MKNNTARTIVNLCKTKSIPLAFVLPNSCSAPPEMAPDKPALLPDCNNTTVIKARDTRINNTNNTVCTSPTS